MIRGFFVVVDGKPPHNELQQRNLTCKQASLVINAYPMLVLSNK